MVARDFGDIPTGDQEFYASHKDESVSSTSQHLPSRSVLEVADNLELMEDQESKQHSGSSPQLDLFKRHTCPRCPAGVSQAASKNNAEKAIACCPRRKTVVKTNTATKKLTKVIKSTKTIYTTITGKKVAVKVSGKLYADAGKTNPVANRRLNLVLLLSKARASARDSEIIDSTITRTDGSFQFSGSAWVGGSLVIRDVAADDVLPMVPLPVIESPTGNTVDVDVVDSPGSTTRTVDKSTTATATPNAMHNRRELVTNGGFEINKGHTGPFFAVDGWTMGSVSSGSGQWGASVLLLDNESDQYGWGCGGKYVCALISPTTDISGGAPHGFKPTSDGKYFAGLLAGKDNTAPIQQEISNLIVGARYILSFQWGCAQYRVMLWHDDLLTAGRGERWTVRFGNETMETRVCKLWDARWFDGWSKETHVFTASASVQTLSFMPVADFAGFSIALLDNVSLVAEKQPTTTVTTATITVQVKTTSKPTVRTTATRTTILNRVNLVANGNFETNGRRLGSQGLATSLKSWTTSFGFADDWHVFLLNETADAVFMDTISNNPARIWGPNNAVPVYNNFSGSAVNNGGYFIGVRADTGDSIPSISQNLTGLVVGETYNVVFQWACAQLYESFGATQQFWTVQFGQESWSTTSCSNPSQGFTYWKDEEHSFTASASTQTLSFLASSTPTGNGAMTLLDTVSVV